MRTIALVPGDCPEILPQVIDLVGKAGADLKFEEAPNGLASLETIRRHKLALVGWSKGNRDQGELPPGVQLRQALNTFAQHRPLRSYPGLPSRFSDVDVLIVRETTEDVYAHLEHESIPDVFESLKVTTRVACERIARHAFRVARENGRKKVTIVHKANILKASDGMFLRVARDVAKEFPDITADDVIVDALCMKLVLDPGRFDVLVCGNMYGDIVADLGCGLVGGPSNAPAINIAEDGTAVFTSAHGSGPDACGTDRVNPLPWLLPVVHLLRHVGEKGASERLDRALRSALADGVRPIAIGGGHAPTAFCAAVGERI